MDQCAYVHQIAHTTLCKLVGPPHFLVKKNAKSKNTLNITKHVHVKLKSNEGLVKHTATKLILLVSSALY
jgi:hypothetical protein